MQQQVTNNLLVKHKTGVCTRGFETVSFCLHAHSAKDIYIFVFAWKYITSLVIDKEAFEICF